MNPDSYTPGHTATALDFMARRSLATHAAFMTPLLKPGLRLLDCACGPGNMTRELAQAVAPGEVVGIDRFSVQFPAEADLPSNLRFRAMDVYALDFPDAHFDGVFSHALFEHLSEPARALAEIRRVLKPGGFVALRSPDWGGFVLEPPGSGEAVADYRAIMQEYGGNPDTGRKLAGWLRAAGFRGVVPTAVYEIYDPPAQIAEFIAFQLDRGGKQASAKALRDWGSSPEALFGIAWFEALGFRAE